MRYVLGEYPSHTVSQQIPAYYRRYLSDGAAYALVTGEEGELLIQQIETELFSINLSHFFIRNECTIHACNDEPVILLQYVLQGEMCKSACQQDMYDPEPGCCQICYVPPGIRYEVSCCNGTYHSIYIDLSRLLTPDVSNRFTILEQLMHRIGTLSANKLLLPQVGICFRARTLLEELVSRNTGEPGAVIFMQARVYELLWLYLHEIDSTSRQDPSLAYTKCIQSVKAYIDLHLDEDMGTSKLARRFGISASTLKRQFKLYIGTAVGNYITLQRMNEAYSLLRHTMLSIHEIGFKVGYTEFSSFTRAFTRHFGHSPKNTRKLPDP